jgi:hypothetical protein
MGLLSKHGGKPDVWQGPEKGSLFRDPKGRLVFEMDGVKHDDITSIRMFPFTDPEHWIALCDKEANEIVCIEDMEALPPATRQLILEDLQAREFVPVIKRVISVSVAADPSDWHVETDRGPTSFTLNDEDDIHRLSPFRILIIDAHGIRYVIPDIRQMDASSRRILSHYI